MAKKMRILSCIVLVSVYALGCTGGGTSSGNDAEETSDPTSSTTSPIKSAIEPSGSTTSVESNDESTQSTTTSTGGGSTTTTSSGTGGGTGGGVTISLKNVIKSATKNMSISNIAPFADFSSTDLNKIQLVTSFPHTTAQGGVFTLESDYTLTYTPALDFVGADSVTVQIVDGNGQNQSATISVYCTADQAYAFDRSGPIQYRMALGSSNAGVAPTVLSDEISNHYGITPLFHLSRVWSESDVPMVGSEYISGITAIDPAMGIRWGTSMITIGDVVYIYGGMGKNWGTVYGRGLITYHVPTKKFGVIYRSSWVAGTDYPLPRLYASLASDGTDLFVFGGRNEPTAFNDVWKFTPATGLWTKLKGLDNNSSGAAGTAYPHRRGNAGMAVANGKLIIVGGGHDGYGAFAGTAYADVWEYSLGTDTFTKLTPTGSTPALHFRYSATDNSKIYLFGGGATVFGASTNRVWEYNIATNTFTEKTGGSNCTASATCPSVRWRGTMQLIGNKLYIFDGADGTGELWAFDLTLNTFSRPYDTSGKSVDVDYPTGRSDAGSAVHGGKLILYGGSGSQTTSQSYDGYAVQDMWSFNPINSQFQRLEEAMYTSNGTFGTDNIGPRVHHAVASLQESYYVFGGENSKIGSTLNDIYKVDPARNTTTLLHARKPPEDVGTGTTFPQGKKGSAMVAFAGNLYIFGGADASWAPSNDFWKFNIATKTFTRLQADQAASGNCSGGDIPSKSMFLSMTVDDNGKIYLMGGANASWGSVPAHMWSYDTQSSSPQFVCELAESNDPGNDGTPQRRHSFKMVYFNNAIYIFGGNGEIDSEINDLWRYDIVSKTYTNLKPIVSKTYTATDAPERRSSFGMALLNGKIMIAGGYADNSAGIGAQHRNDLWSYDIGGDTFERLIAYNNGFKGSLHHTYSEGYERASLVAVSGKVYTLGGEGYPNYDFQNSFGFDPSLKISGYAPSLFIEIEAPANTYLENSGQNITVNIDAYATGDLAGAVAGGMTIYAWNAGSGEFVQVAQNNLTALSGSTTAITMPLSYFTDTRKLYLILRGQNGKGTQPTVLDLNLGLSYFTLPVY